jgi:hypothetical protein
MTTIAEKKREVGYIFGFLAIVLGFAAWRGAEKAPIIALLVAIGAGICVIALIYVCVKPTPLLTVSPDEIWYGQLDQPGTRIDRSETARLTFVEGFKESGWFLVLADEPNKPGLSMIGFDLAEVRAACVAHGWAFV